MKIRSVVLHLMKTFQAQRIIKEELGWPLWEPGVCLSGTSKGCQVVLKAQLGLETANVHWHKSAER